MLKFSISQRIMFIFQNQNARNNSISFWVDFVLFSAAFPCPLLDQSAYVFS